MSAEPVSLTAIQPLQTLVVERYGARISKHSQRLRVIVKDEVQTEAPLIYLRQLILKGHGISLSSDVILACAERGIALHVVSATSGASLYTAGLTGTVVTRRAQLLAYNDYRALAVAGAIALAKLHNQANLLTYYARSRKKDQPKLALELRCLAREIVGHQAELDALLARANADARPVPIERYRAAILSIEGRAAQRYWAGVGQLLPAELGWPGRRTRGARDPFNSALNYGYAILARLVEQAILLAGLEPFAGFLHADRPGKPSLTLDLLEEFRQIVVDRVVIGLVGKRVPLTMRDDGLLDDDTRQLIAERVVDRIEHGLERYEGKRRTLREIIQTQAHHLATYLRGDRPAYSAFIAR
jgi:CRISPR-associated protein Cas1